MSQKIALTAAILAVALSQTQATWLSRQQQEIAEQRARERKQHQQQLQSFDEDEWQGSVGVSYGNQSGFGVNVGISHTWEEEQEQELQKIKIGSALKKAANVIVKANELGLLEEEQWGGEMYGEYGRQGGQTNWKVGGKITFDEEQEEVEQKFKLGKALKKAANVVVKAHEIGLFDEEDMIAEEQKIKIGKALKKVANVVVKAKEIGLFDEEEEEDNELQFLPAVVVAVGGEILKDVAISLAVDATVDGVKHIVKHYSKHEEDEDEVQSLPLNPLMYKPVRDFVRDTVDNTVNWARNTFKDEDEEQVYIDLSLRPEEQISAFHDYLRKCERNPAACKMRKFDEDEEELQGVWGPIIKEVGKEVGKSVAAQVIADGVKGGAKWVRNQFKDEDEETLQGGEIYGEFGRQGGKNDWKVGGKWTFKDEEELPIMQPIDAKWCQKNPRACHHKYNILDEQEQTIKSTKPAKWSHNGFKPKFEKPSHLRFTDNEHMKY